MKIIENDQTPAFRNYQVFELSLVHGAHVPTTPGPVKRLVITCVDSIVLEMPWSHNIESTLSLFQLHHSQYRMLVGRVASGNAGSHDWSIVDGGEDGFQAFVDGRPLGYRKSFPLAQMLAFNLIERIQADGDYRLNDRPAGFNPPQFPALEFRPCLTKWRHGGWYVNNVVYASKAIGCISNNYPDGRWRIVCDDRRDQLDAPGDYTYATREEAALAEFWIANAPVAYAAGGPAKANDTLALSF